VRGRLVLQIRTPRAARVRVELTFPRGKKAALRVGRRTTALPGAGIFTRRLKLRGKRLPGAYEVQVRELAAPGTSPGPSATRSVRLSPPPEGVVSRAFISRRFDGPPVARIRGRLPVIIFSTFRFAAQPAKGRRLRVRWFFSGARKAGPVADRARRIVRGVVVSSLNRAGRQVGRLPEGRYRAELLAGNRLVAVARVRLGG
jgi:hypothetical protein